MIEENGESRRLTRVWRLAGLIGLVFLSACASTSEMRAGRAADATLAAPDQLPRFNRKLLNMNMGLDKRIVRPLASGYRAIAPAPVETSISAFFRNLGEPLTFVNDVLQVAPERAGTTLLRFVINTTVGIGGLFDPAAKMGLAHHDEDFGQTFAVWGADPGTYVVVPILGPLTMRDAIGSILDFTLDPMNFAVAAADVKGLAATRLVTNVVDARARNFGILDELYARTDVYIAVREAYLQNRAFEITNGAIRQSEEEEDLFDEEFD